MKILNTGKNEILERLEQFARHINQTAQQVVIQDPSAFAEQIRRKGAELYLILKATLFKERARISHPEFLRTKVKKRVIENLEDDLQYPEVIEVVTDCLIKAAKSDPYYRQLLGLEEYLV